jgi:hypothetical protein
MLNPTAPSERMETTRADICPMPLNFMALSSIVCLCSASRSARVKIRSAVPGKVFSYRSNSFEGGNGRCTQEIVKKIPGRGFYRCSCIT